MATQKLSKTSQEVQSVGFQGKKKEIDMRTPEEHALRNVNGASSSSAAIRFPKRNYLYVVKNISFCLHKRYTFYTLRKCIFG